MNSKQKKKKANNDKNKSIAKKPQPSNTKVLLLMGGVFAVLIGILIALFSYQDVKLADSPYQTSKLNGATIDSLDDPNYQNIILPGELDEKLGQGEDAYVFFFSPLCKHCENAKDDITKAFKDTETEVFHYNVLEFEDGFDDYDLKGTPTVAYFKDGKFESSLIGAKTYDEYVEWLADTKTVIVAEENK